MSKGAVLPDGSIALVYDAYNREGDDPCVSQAAVAAIVGAYGATPYVDDSRPRARRQPNIAADSSGRLYAVRQEGIFPSQPIKGARFETAVIFGDGFETGSTARW